MLSNSSLQFYFIFFFYKLLFFYKFWCGISSSSAYWSMIFYVINHFNSSVRTSTLLLASIYTVWIKFMYDWWSHIAYSNIPQSKFEIQAKTPKYWLTHYSLDYQCGNPMHWKVRSSWTWNSWDFPMLNLGINVANATSILCFWVG